MEKRKKEFAIELISGLSLNSLAFSIGILNLIISLISLIGAFIIRTSFSYILSKFIYSFIHLESTLILITKDGLVSTCAMLFINILLLCLLNVGLGYRTEICNLIRSKETSAQKVKYLKYDFSESTSTSFKLLSSIFITCLAFMPLCIILISNTIDELQVLTIFSSVGIFFFIFKLLPILFAQLGKTTQSKIDTIIFKNLVVNTKKNRASLISILTISLFTVYFLGEYSRNKYLSVAGIGISFLLILLFLLTSLYSFSSLGNLKLKNLKILFSLGFTKKDLEKIILKESILNTILLCCIPFLLICVNIFKLLSMNQITISIASLIFFIIILAILISFLGSYLLYKDKLKTII